MGKQSNGDQKAEAGKQGSGEAAPENPSLHLLVSDAPPLQLSSPSPRALAPSPRSPFAFSTPLYAIADTLGRPELSFTTLTKKLCAGGARILQLRVKDLPTQEFLAIAREVRTICQRHHCLFIVNDRADIALAVDADGVHVGQEDLPLTAARRVLGAGKIIGVSTHDPAQACKAEQEGADYIGFGPLFGTNTKATGYTARGLHQLREIRALVRLPIVAIGGVTAASAPSALASGANAVAMISDLVLATDILGKVQETLARLSVRQ